MEAKKSSATAIAAVCVLLLLVLPGQVAAKSKFCECYENCYRRCRHNLPRIVCVPFCANKCSPRQAAAAAATGGSDADQCREACKAVKICGQANPTSEDEDECARGCQ